MSDLSICHLNVGGTVEGFAGQRSGREHIVDAAIEAQGVLGCAAASVAAAGLVFGIDGGAEQDAVAVGSRRPDHAGIENPAADGLALDVFVLRNEGGVGSLREAEQSFDVQPVAAFLEQNQFPSAFGLAELVGSCVGRQVDDGLADQRAAIGGQQQGVSQHDQGDQKQKLDNRFHGSVRLRFEGST